MWLNVQIELWNQVYIYLQVMGLKVCYLSLFIWFYYD